MTATIDMFDAIDDSLYPPAGTGVCFAGYVDGNLGDQPDYAWLVKNRPGSPILSIALKSGNDAQCLDIEPGAATPESAAGWYERQKARGISRPALYASASKMESDVVPVITAAGIARESVRLWTAHYESELGAHICGPSSCRELSIDADGTQWTTNAMGRDLDQSLLLANFFGEPAPPADWTFGPPRHLTARGGHTSVMLEWDPPEGAPEAPAEYQVYVYRGPVCNRTTLVATYPRTVKTSPWEGGSLEQGASYVAHVVASGPGGTRVRPYCYAADEFSTG